MAKPKGWKGEHKRHVEAGRKGARRRRSESSALAGTSVRKKDILLVAKRPGKRNSKRGKIYYEYRANRADSNRKLKL